MTQDKGDYPVGYGKPPAHARFRKGQSGNPSGKPKKILTEEEIVLRDLASKVTVTEGGKQRRMSKLEVILKQQVKLAMKGDPKAVRFVAEILRMAKQSLSSGNQNQGEERMVFTLVFEEEELRRQELLKEQGTGWRDENSSGF
jgi:hypothetical protein